MKKRIKVGIVGFGYMGRFHYIKTKQMDSVDTIGIFDIDEGAKTHAQEENLKVYNNYQDMLDDDLDLIVISTPNDSHYKYAKCAM